MLSIENNQNKKGTHRNSSVAARLDPAELKLAKYYTSDQFNHQGDFIAHAASVHQKAAVIELLLQRAAYDEI
jgi:hypothetical protein